MLVPLSSSMKSSSGKFAAQAGNKKEIRCSAGTPYLNRQRWSEPNHLQSLGAETFYRLEQKEHMVNQSVNAAVHCSFQTFISIRKHDGGNPQKNPSVFSAAHHIPQEILDSPALLLHVPSWRNGRRARLKIEFQKSVGSSPTGGTNQ